MSRFFPISRNIFELSVLFSRGFALRKIANYHSCHKANIFNVQGKINPNLSIRRFYGKSKDKIKKGNKSIAIDERELGEIFEVENLFGQFKKPLENLKRQYVEQLTFRSASAIENIKVKHDGNTYLLQELAEIGRKNPKELVLEMGAFVSAIPSVVEALQKSNLNLNPLQNGTTIYVKIPRVTTEHREGLAKSAKALFNKCKETIRDVQNKNIRKVQNVDNLSEETAWRLKTQLTKLGDKHIAEAEELLKIKQKELLIADSKDN